MEAIAMFVVAVYDCGQRYGGPEEGGWWYDAGSLVRPVKLLRGEDRAYAYARRLNTRLYHRACSVRTLASENTRLSYRKASYRRTCSKVVARLLASPIGGHITNNLGYR